MTPDIWIGWLSVGMLSGLVVVFWSAILWALHEMFKKA